eukprot:6097590-Prymnesium_polylepis.1
MCMRRRSGSTLAASFDLMLRASSKSSSCASSSGLTPLGLRAGITPTNDNNGPPCVVRPITSIEKMRKSISAAELGLSVARSLVSVTAASTTALAATASALDVSVAI